MQLAGAPCSTRRGLVAAASAVLICVAITARLARSLPKLAAGLAFAQDRCRNVASSAGVRRAAGNRPIAHHAAFSFGGLTVPRWVVASGDPARTWSWQGRAAAPR
jgi:hypothetical protein